MMGPILPPAQLGILGGGQLGRMFAVAAKTMGYRVAVLDPDACAPAAAFADVHLCAAYDDPAALASLGASCAAVTTEFENVDAGALRVLASRTRVSPSADCVAIAQDRLAEKAWINRAGLPTTHWLPVQSLADLDADLTAYLPGILKTSRMGYDGKGQLRVNTAEDARQAFASLGHCPCLLEKMLDLQQELSVIVARTAQDQVAVFPVAENLHRNGILDISVVPARVTAVLLQTAQEMAQRLADALDYIGVMAVEFFVLADQQLVVNEIAPRPHNSGHFTLDACVTDQFQQQVRTLCGLVPGSTRLLSPVAMVNLLGDVWPDASGEPHWEGVLADRNAHLHLYGKDEARIGRKMGHYTVLANDAEQAFAQAQALFATL